MSSKQCPECGEKIIGRTDKKFCSDGCRNTYNNRMNKDQKNLMRNINNRLRKNWRILEQLNPHQKTKKQELSSSRWVLISIILRAFIPPNRGTPIILCMTKDICLLKMIFLL